MAAAVTEPRAAQANLEQHRLMDIPIRAGRSLRAHHDDRGNVAPSTREPMAPNDDRAGTCGPDAGGFVLTRRRCV